MRSILYWFAGYLPCRIISDGNTPYLERYYLFTLLGWRFYLHRFVGSDPDRGLHDHPWSRAFSIIMAGWYWEETRSGTRKVRWFNALTGDTFHRVVLPARHQSGALYPLRWALDDHPKRAFLDSPAPCWTLFFHRAEYVKSWGFWRSIEDEQYGECAYFQPYIRTRSDEMPDWWNRVPNGRNEPRRAAP